MSTSQANANSILTFGVAINIALDLLDGDDSVDTEYGRGICEVLANMYLGVGNTVVAAEMIRTALKSKEW